MNRMITGTIKRLFPNDFSELQPVKKRWWQKIDFSHLKKKEGLLAVLLASVMFLYGIYYYNKFIGLSRYTEMEQHQIEVQLQRRKNLSSNLARMVIEYAEHERQVYQYMADKRSDSLNKSELLADVLKKGGFGDLATVKAGDAEGALAKFMAIGEAYPDLKLSVNFQKLMDALIESENRIAASRMEYNKAASIFHAAVREVPACFYAYIFGYRENMFHYAEVDDDIQGRNRFMNDPVKNIKK